MGFGLGYIADGLLKGQERNLNLGLRRKQEERAQTAFGLQVPVFEAKAQEAKEYVTPEAIERRNVMASNDLTISSNRAESSGYDRDLKKNDASATNLGIRNDKFSAELLATQNRAKGIGLGNIQTQQQIDLGNERLSPDAVKLRENERKFALEAQAWEQNLRKVVNQSDQMKARTEASEAIDNRDFRVLQLIRSGESAGAAMLINGFGDNPHGDIVDVKQTKEGGVVGYNRKGEVAVSYTPEQVAGLESRIKARAAKASQSKVIMVPVFNEMGDKIGERPAITETDSETGEQYIKYLEERKESTSSSVSHEEEVDYARNMVKGGEMTPEQFQRIYHQAYTPSQNNASPSPSNKPKQDDYDVDIPLIF
jgi:hypothetical protein